MKNNILKQNINNKGGFSLIELLIYIAILGGLIVISTNMFVSLSRGYGQSQAKSEVDSAIRFSTELIKQDIKNASIITTPATGTSSSTLVLTRNGVTITYDISSGVLRRTEGASVPVSVTSPNISVSNLNFTRVENTNTLYSDVNISIRLNITFGYNSTNPNWTYSTSLQTTVGLY